MSAKLDLVRSIYADWDRGLFRSLDWAHPEWEYVWADGPSPGSWTGLAAAARAFGEFMTSWAEFRPVAEAYRELDDERVLVLVDYISRGKTSGIETHARGAAVFHVREGAVTRFAGYFDRDRALADVGLTMEGGS